MVQPRSPAVQRPFGMGIVVVWFAAAWLVGCSGSGNPAANENKATEGNLAASKSVATGAPIKASEKKQWSGKTSFAGHAEPVSALAFSPNGAWLAAGSADGDIKIWNVATAQEHKQLSIGSRRAAHQVAFTPDGRHFLAAMADGIRIWDTGNWEFKLLGAAERSSHFAISPDGQRLAAGSPSSKKVLLLKLPDGGADGEVLVEHVIMGSEDLAFSNDGKHLAVLGISPISGVKIWDLATKSAVKVLDTSRDHPRRVRFAPDGKTLVTGARQIRLWDRTTWDVKQWTTKQYVEHVRAMEFTSDGKWLAVVDESGGFMLWDVGAGATQYGTGANRETPFKVLAVSPDLSCIALAATNKSVEVWELKEFIPTGGKPVSR